MNLFPNPSRQRISLSIAALVLTVAATRAGALEGEHNRLPEACQGVAGASFLVYEAAATFTEFPLDLAPSAGAFGSNWALKLCPPQILAPPAYKADPDRLVPEETPEPLPPDEDPACYRTVIQPVTKAQYENFLGASLPLGDWGELGTPQVYHFNSAADVRILTREPGVVNSPETRVRLADHLKTRQLENGDIVVNLPVGRYDLVYRADTLVSPLDFVPLYIPGTPGGSQAFKQTVRKSGTLRSAATALLKAGQQTFEVIEGAARDYTLDEALGINWRHSQLRAIDDIYNEDRQEIWIYDLIPPTLSTRTDLSTFPERVRAVLSYDPSQQTYYLEAIQPGGISAANAVGFLRDLIEAKDHCNHVVDLVHDSGGASFWPVGAKIQLVWTARDPGPTPGGGRNATTLAQSIEVRDSHPPILLAPPSRVIEIPAGESQAQVNLGSPRVFDLADLSPEVTASHPDGAFPLGLTEVSWTASDGVNTSEPAIQLINIKEEGTNTAPVADAQTVQTQSFAETEILLSGTDADFHPTVNRHDPLTFSIVQEPENGFFVAPLLPFFIDDYRLEASATQFADQPWNQDPHEYCRSRNGSFGPGEPRKWQMGYPFDATWMAVDDAGRTIVFDLGDVECLPGTDLRTSARLAMFDAQHQLIRTATVPGGVFVQDVYWDNQTGFVYVSLSDSQSSDDMVIVYDDQLVQQVQYVTGRGPVGTTATPKFVVSDRRGILYVGSTENFGIKAYRQVTGVTRVEGGDVYLGDAFPNTFQNEIESLAIDSQNNLYVGYNNRVVKVSAARLNEDGTFVPGEMIGWMGRCDGNLTNVYACDTPTGRSVGYACTNELCAATPGNFGPEPGQFNDAHDLAIDPNGILYVSDTGNSRVQRFTPDGFFAGQAKSRGAGYGFLLGDFGQPRNIEVNSDHFYILSDEADLLHIFASTPIEPVDDGHARVVYRSNNNFVGTDVFRFAVTDGLDSAEAAVTVNVSRNFRAPEVPDAATPVVVDALAEDAAASIPLRGTDADGALDTLNAVLVMAPEHGTVTFQGLTARYLPDPDYVGADAFTYRISDGREESADTGRVEINIEEVEDEPLAEAATEVSVNRGFVYTHRVDVYDPDAGENLLVSIDWGDGTSVEEGHLELNGTPIPWQEATNADGTLKEGVEATDPILSLDPTGRGVLMADHAYVQPGAYTINSCVRDKVNLDEVTQQKLPTGASKTTCTATTVDVGAAAELVIESEVPPDEVARGTRADVVVRIRNRPFDIQPDDPRFGALPATGAEALGVTLTGEVSRGLTIISATLDSGTCTRDATTLECAIPLLPYAGEATLNVTLEVAQNAAGSSSPALALTAEWLDGLAPMRGSARLKLPAIAAAASLARLTPGFGDPLGDVEVTLEGANFEEGARIFFGATPALDVRVVDAETVIALAPSHPPGEVDVTLVNPDEEETTLADAFRFGDAAEPNPNPGPAPNPNPNPPPNPGSAGGGGGGGVLSLAFVLALAMLLAGRLRSLHARRGHPGASRT